jgi:hypothetical protein
MISVEGAALIAQVYPVAILLLLLETGRIIKSKPMTGRFGRTYTLSTLSVTAVAILSATGAVTTCLTNAVADVPVEGFAASYVPVTGWALAFAVSMVTGHILGGNFLDWMEMANADKRAERARIPQSEPSASTAAL